MAKRLGDATVRMLAYNGSIPGPVLKVQEGSEVVVNQENQGDMEATVHWHGLRLENRYDGTHQTQQPMAVGETFSARVAFPDPGLYWYRTAHPRGLRAGDGPLRQRSGRTGGPRLRPPVHREVLLTLDDILLEEGQGGAVQPGGDDPLRHGSLRDVLLVNGETDLSLTAKLREIVRLYLTNTANTRVFKVALPGARMKLVGGDSGRVEHEQFVADVVLAPLGARGGRRAVRSSR